MASVQSKPQTLLSASLRTATKLRECMACLSCARPNRNPTEGSAHMDTMEKQAQAELGINYRGVWKAGEQFKAGEFVTHGGSLWTALADSMNTKPGAGPAAWKLCVKGGSQSEAQAEQPAAAAKC